MPTNERLEFLGDAVLGFVVAEALYRDNPDLSEDQLSRMRIAVVSRAGLAGIGRALGVGDAVLLGRGEEAQGGRDKDSILEDTTEALIGAVCVVHGIDAARDVVLRVTGPLLRRSADATDRDRKTALQTLLAERSLPPARYEVETAGPEHAREFRAQVSVGGEVLGSGSGRTKKTAEHAAADAAVLTLLASPVPGD